MTTITAISEPPAKKGWNLLRKLFVGDLSKDHPDWFAVCPVCGGKFQFRDKQYHFGNILSIWCQEFPWEYAQKVCPKPHCVKSARDKFKRLYEQYPPVPKPCCYCGSMDTTADACNGHECDPRCSWRCQKCRDVCWRIHDLIDQLMRPRECAYPSQPYRKLNKEDKTAELFVEIGILEMQLGQKPLNEIGIGSDLGESYAIRNPNPFPDGIPFPLTDPARDRKAQWVQDGANSFAFDGVR